LIDRVVPWLARSSTIEQVDFEGSQLTLAQYRQLLESESMEFCNFNNASIDLISLLKPL